MNCPVCKQTTLVDHELEPGLPSRTCRHCGGQWIDSQQYWKWLEAHKPDEGTAQAGGGSTPSAAAQPAAAEYPSVESPKAKLCPECGRFLTRAKVGRGADFSLDRCYTCGGIWLDANEWQSLKARQLHDRVHLIFSSAWQAEVARREREKSRENLLRSKFGEQDLAEIQRIKAWLSKHPRRAELYAVLVDDFESPPRS